MRKTDNGLLQDLSNGRAKVRCFSCQSQRKPKIQLAKVLRSLQTLGGMHLSHISLITPKGDPVWVYLNKLPSTMIQRRMFLIKRMDLMSMITHPILPRAISFQTLRSGI